VKLQFLGNNLKTVNKNRNLTRGKNDQQTSRLHGTHIVMNKGEINTGESNENENVHKFNESVVSKNCYNFNYKKVVRTLNKVNC
jgi:hypothetical protein